MKKNIIFILLLFVLSINFVKAETLTLKQVGSKVKEILIKENNGQNAIDVLTTDNSITLKVDDFSMLVPFENDILSFKYSYNDIDSLRYAGGFAAILKALVELHGYTEKDWEYFGNIENATLENDGYECILVNDTEMKFSANINDFKLKTEYIKAEKPIVILSKTEENTVSVSAKVNAEDGTQVDFYGSNDGENFEYLFSGYVYSEKTASISISNVLEDNLNYYKAVVAKSNNFSDVVSTKALDEDNDENNNSNNNENQNNQESNIDNPKTGTNSITALIFIGLIGGTTLYLSKKKNKVHKI